MSDETIAARKVASEWKMDEARALKLAIGCAHAIAVGDLDATAFAVSVAQTFGADAGVGLTTIDEAAGDLVIRVAVGDAPALDENMLARAAPFAQTHPGFRSMRRLGTTSATRLSDDVSLPWFWQTESWQAMHGHSDGRFPMAALLHESRESFIFVGAHRRHQDFSDDEVILLSRMQQPLAQAYRYRAALDFALSRLAQIAGAASPDPLIRPSHTSNSASVVPTRREAEVLALMAAGWTNNQIAGRLQISERTVRKHLSAVYEKAGLPGRAAAASWWSNHQADVFPTT